MLLVVGGVLAVTIALVASLASYYTDRQNQAGAFGDLAEDLLAWQGDLDASTIQSRKAALAIAADDDVLDHLAGMQARATQAQSHPGQDAQIERALGGLRAALLKRLYLMLRTGAFSSIQIYTTGRLTQYVAPSEAGMLVHLHAGAPVWIRTALGPEVDHPFEHWPSWEESRPPVGVPIPTPGVTVPTVLTSFPAADIAAIDVAVPAITPEEAHAGVLGVLVFRKLIDRAALLDLARRTGQWPVVLSLDGTHRQEVSDLPLFSAVSLRGGQWQQRDGSPIRRWIANTGHGSFYMALSPWRFEGQPRLMLGFALSREKTAQNVAQTVVAILIVAAAIAIASMAIGAFWVRRFTDPIVALTTAAKGIMSTRLVEQDGPALQQLRPIDIRAPDAFNTMVAELRRSFVTLEERVRARTEEVRLQTHYLRAVIDSIPLLVSLKDPQGRYLAANEAMAKNLGLRSVDEMIGRTIGEIRPDLASRYGEADDMRALSTGTAETQTLQVDSETGATWLERFRAPVTDEDGKVLGLVRVTRDITLQKTAESAREAALADAMHLARLRSEFMARMSHELRTPLNAILGYAQILERDAHLTDRQASRIAVIRSSGEHLLNIINDILDLARIDAEKLELTPTEQDLTELVRAVAEIIRIKAREKGLEFRCESAPLPGTVWVDAKRLRQVLLNLLSNAVKFTDRGAIVLRMRPLSEAANGSAEGVVPVRFEVQDSGIGMNCEQVARLFRPFEQVAEISRREGGAGLGLAISQQLVRLMGGRIMVESQPEKGSLFYLELTFPLITARGARTEAATADHERRVVGYEGRRCSILIVDDIPVNRVVLIDMLTCLGFDILEAANGREALEVLQTHKPDLIIMDTVMPIMDGLEATRRIRGTEGVAHIPIFAVSANVAHEDALRNLEAGANAVLPKPVDLRRLLEAISEHLGVRWIYEEEERLIDLGSLRSE
jgi:PAS domain S-box-containing protein